MFNLTTEYLKCQQRMKTYFLGIYHLLIWLAFDGLHQTKPFELNNISCISSFHNMKLSLPENTKAISTHQIMWPHEGRKTGGKILLWDGEEKWNVSELTNLSRVQTPILSSKCSWVSQNLIHWPKKVPAVTVVVRSFSIQKSPHIVVGRRPFGSR